MKILDTFGGTSFTAGLAVNLDTNMELDTMTRIPSVKADQTEGYIAKILKAQATTWGGPLLNHLLYARRPALFKAVRGMWAALNQGKILDEVLVALLNRRVASLNGCVF